MVFDRPPKPGQQNLATQRNQPQNPGKQGTNPQSKKKTPPSPWLGHPRDLTPQPNPSASFVEYLRWMRSPDDPNKDAAKVQILQRASENANYQERLSELNQRTKRLAGEAHYFEVKCPWRIRVGGHRGPESILLPAFDALGMPYIPSSSLRGVARTQAILHFIGLRMSLKDAEIEVAKYFGALDTSKNHCMGKVIFLDAYPVPSKTDKSGGLSIDIANNIWQWDNNNLTYDPNPQTFFSLKESTFLIGIRPGNNCTPDCHRQVKQWLIAGLQSGIGSQVNTGYGNLILPQQNQPKDNFFQVKFSLEGQLIHGRQKIKNLHEPYKRDEDGSFRKNEKQELILDTEPDAEVRSIAFKSMLRYWFRAFASGVLPIGNIETLKTYLDAHKKGENIKPPAEVKALEAILFGSITPQTRGWVQFQITEGKIVTPEAKNKNDAPGEQSGILTLSYSGKAPQTTKDAIKKLFRNLTWMMFHLGGVGQGARRPCYSRKERANPKPPWWRGSCLIPESEDTFWELPETIGEFQRLFQQRLRAFYEALQNLTGRQINSQSPLIVGQVKENNWVEVVDSNCRIIVCKGSEDNYKPYALGILHYPSLKKDGKYDSRLCGAGARPSPVWIADLGDYQVVTIFGATQAPRNRFLEKLRSQTDNKDYALIFPLTRQLPQRI